MQINIPPDLEAIVQKQLATGAFADVEDVFRCALENLDADERWTEEERQALDEKIDRAREQVAVGKVYGPEEARQKLSEMKRSHLTRQG